MQPWFLIGVLGIICFIVLVYLRRANDAEGFAGFKDDQMKFANSQYSRFHDNLGKEILTNPGLNLGKLNAALAQPDLYLPNSPARNYLAYFGEDPEAKFIDDDEQFCKAARHPRDLPARIPGSATACGWYFISEPSRPSVGVLGTAGGPVIKSSATSGGEWIWDINTAIMKEDIKNCKRVKLCDLMNIDGIHGVCGFCERLGHAVPVDANGKDKYPDSQDGACGEQSVMTVDKCFKPAPLELVSEDGTQCGTYGTPSPDNSIRLYTTAECNKLGGSRLLPSGECMMQGGGSFSSACRGLNDVATVSAQATKCAPDARGNLTRACLISLAAGIGYSKSGAILRLLETSGSPNETDRMALDTLKTNGVLLPDALLGAGNIDADSAGNLYQKIYAGMTSGQSKMAREAAKWLVVGTNGFDICEFDAGANGPFPLTCMQRAFRQAGCQPAGGANPTAATASNYANMTWAQINTAFKDMRNTTKSPDADTQDKATADCLGIKYFRPPPIDSEYGIKLNTDSPSNDIACYTNNEPASKCRTECTNNANCRGYLEVLPNTGYWGNKGGCCTKHDVVSRLGTFRNLTLHPKIDLDPSFTVQENRDSPGNDIACYSKGESSDKCRAECMGNTKCNGYVYVRPNTVWGGASGCCLKTDVTSRLGAYNGLSLYTKKQAALKWYEIAAQGKWVQEMAASAVRTVGIGNSNQLMITNSSQSIYRKEAPLSGGWQWVNGGLAQVDAKSNVIAVGVNGGGVVYNWSGGDWRQITNNNGTAWASIGADGTIYTIAKDGGIYRYLGSPNQFVRIPGALVQISVGDANNIWGVTSGDVVFKWNGNDWQRIPGGLTRVAVSAGGTRVVGVSRDGRIWAYNGGDSWTLIPGSLTNISVCQDYIAGVNSTGQLYYLKLA
jgi:hypothetical protein